MNLLVSYIGTSYNNVLAITKEAAVREKTQLMY